VRKCVRKAELKAIRRAARNWFRAIKVLDRDPSDFEARLVEKKTWFRFSDEGYLLALRFGVKSDGEYDLGHGVSLTVEANGLRVWPEVAL
jgi:hypothetical protein